MTERKKIHPFARTLGKGPYRYVGFFDLGACVAALNAGNTYAYQNGMASAPRLKAGMGTCAHCGMAIMNVYIVRNGEGELYGVGCECIRKCKAEGETVDNTTEMERKIKEVKSKKAFEASEKRRTAATGFIKLILEANEKRLQSLPHPSPWFKDKSALDYINFCFSKGGISEQNAYQLINKIEKMILSA